MRFQAFRIESQRLPDFLHPRLVFRDGAQHRAVVNVGPAVAHAGDRNVVLAGFERRHQGGPHAFEARIPHGLAKHLEIGVFHSAQQGCGIAVGRAREHVGHAFHGELRGPFAPPGSTHTVGQQKQTQFRDDPE